MSCRSGWEEVEGLGLVEECAGGGGCFGVLRAGGEQEERVLHALSPC